MLIHMYKSYQLAYGFGASPEFSLGDSLFEIPINPRIPQAIDQI